MSTKRTPWFSGDVKPVHKGVYERDYSEGNNPESGCTFCKWDGFEWKTNYRVTVDAHYGKKRSAFQQLPWRGLTKPSKESK